MHYQMGERKKKILYYLLILLSFSSMVDCSGYMFQRIDKHDAGIMPVGFTRHYHQCSIDSECNYVVKKSQGSQFEKKHEIDDVNNYYHVWEKQKIRHAVKYVPTSNVALNKPASMSSRYDFTAAASNAVDGNLVSTSGTCAVTQKEPTSPWLLVDLLSEYHILYVKIKNRENTAFIIRSQPFDVRVGNNNENGGTSNKFCVQQGSIPTANTLKRFDCPQGTRGRYISFHTPPNQSYLELCELEAYGVTA